MREIFLHSLSHKLAFIFCDEWLPLLRASNGRGMDESDLICLDSCKDRSYSLSSFKTGSSRLTVWDAAKDNMLQDGMHFYGGTGYRLFVGKPVKLPVIDDETVKFFSSCGYKASAQEIEQTFNTEESLCSTIRIGEERWRECDEHEEKVGLKTKKDAQRYCELVRKDVRTLVLCFLGQYVAYSSPRELQEPGVVYCSCSEWSSAPEDAEVNYLDRVEKAVRRLAQCRKATRASGEVLQRAAMSLRRDGRISLERYEKMRRYISDSQELSRVLDKLLRIFVIDTPIQLWVDLTRARVNWAELNPVFYDHNGIMAAGTSLSRISPLLPYTVAANTSALLAEMRARIKKELWAGEYEQTRLESKLLPDWFKQAELDIVNEDRQPAVGGTQE